jgi:AcrR family transcriptional regulator
VQNDRRRTRQLDSEAIVDAAADLFDKKGYQNTTMQDLAEVLGIAKPTLYTRIGSKLELLERIFERVVEVGSRQFDIGSGVAPEIRIPEILRGWTYSAVRLRSHYSIFYSDERELPPGLLKQFRQWSADNIEFLRNLIKEGQEARVLRADLVPTIVAFDIIAIGNWTARWFDERGALTLEQIAATHCELFLGGLLAPESSR